MIEFTEFRQNPAAPTIFVNKIGAIYRVSQNITKVTFALDAGRGAPLHPSELTISAFCAVVRWQRIGAGLARHNKRKKR